MLDSYDKEIAQARHQGLKRHSGEGVRIGSISKRRCALTGMTTGGDRGSPSNSLTSTVYLWQSAHDSVSVGEGRIALAGDAVRLLFGASGCASQRT